MSRSVHPLAPSAARALRRLSAVQRRQLRLWLDTRQLTLSAARVRLAAEFGVTVSEAALARFRSAAVRPRKRASRDSALVRFGRALGAAHERALDALYTETRHVPEAVALLARLRLALDRTVEDLA